MNKSAVIVKESLLPLDDQWGADLSIIDQIDSVPEGDYDPSVVLCTLKGILSDFGESTRNDRWYTKELWNKVLRSELFNEAVRTRTLFGESDHPMDIEDRSDIHYDYVSHAIRDVYIDENDNCVKGTIDILDTPSGRILFTFIRYGSTLGVSSRGCGNLIERLPNGSKRYIVFEQDGSSYTLDDNGNQYGRDSNNRVEVDPDDYEFYTWDVVHRPSNRRARIKRTNENARNSSSILDKLVESAKNDKKSLSWIKKLTESTDVSNREEIVDKINEYVDMLQGDDDSPNSVTDTEYTMLLRQNDQYRDDISELLKMVSVLKSENSDLKLKLNNNQDSNTMLSDLIDKVNVLESRISRSNKHLRKSLKNTISEKEDEIDGSEIMDRIDEVYSKLSVPLKKLGEMIRASDDFVVGKIDKIVPELNKSQINDNSNELKSRLRSSEYELEENKKLLSSVQDDLKSYKEDNLELKENYIHAKCNTLGINPTYVMKEIPGRLSDCSLSDIDSAIDSFCKNYRIPTTVERVTESRKPISRVKVITQNNDTMNESYDSASNRDSMLDLIRNNQ